MSGFIAICIYHVYKIFVSNPELRTESRNTIPINIIRDIQLMGSEKVVGRA